MTPTNVDRLALAKRWLCEEVMAATSSFDLAKRLWDLACLEPANNRFSGFSGMMPVLAVFERLFDGKLYYKKLDPNTATEWSGEFGEFDWMGVDEVEVSLAQFTKKELVMVDYNMWFLRDHDHDHKCGRRYVCLADPEWLRNEYEGDALRNAVYQSLSTIERINASFVDYTDMILRSMSSRPES